MAAGIKIKKKVKVKVKKVRTPIGEPTKTAAELGVKVSEVVESLNIKVSVSLPELLNLAFYVGKAWSELENLSWTQDLPLAVQELKQRMENALRLMLTEKPVRKKYWYSQVEEIRTECAELANVTIGKLNIALTKAVGFLGEGLEKIS